MPQPPLTAVLRAPQIEILLLEDGRHGEFLLSDDAQSKVHLMEIPTAEARTSVACSVGERVVPAHQRCRLSPLVARSGRAGHCECTARWAQECCQAGTRLAEALASEAGMA